MVQFRAPRGVKKAIRIAAATEGVSLSDYCYGAVLQRLTSERNSAGVSSSLGRAVSEPRGPLVSPMGGAQ